ncbi:DoxX family protein [Pseudacidovorax sp. RU35E]|jgi:putative oxidoreductase|uniref:DoxX family protein n=1 Tax=Pseudacidovorax sp. RU35E TaxID=1907403 RepID=UPI000957423A|nr:DoxX family protein [Pseudacidovorax sp. RU35E]SIQ17314.1 putative oxidoreductase [Pseudacidovorax sp. RU35E]
MAITQTSNTTPTQDAAALVGRVLISLLFLPAGWSKLTGFAGTVGYFGKIGVPMPEVAAVIAVVVELLVCLLFLVGFKTRLMAIILAVFTVATAFLGHAFWNVPPEMLMAQKTNFFKNLAIAGGFLAFFAFGPGRFSVDKR